MLPAWQIHLRWNAIGHYAAAAAILTIYGVGVCNFIGSLHPALWFATVAGTLALQLIIRTRLELAIVTAAQPAERPSRAFLLEVGIFLGGATTVGLLNYVWHAFPAASAFKSAVGFAAVGMFAATDQAIAHILDRFETGGLRRERPTIRWPLVLRLAALATAILVFSITIAGLVLLRILDSGVASEQETKALIATELAFVAIVFAAYVANLLRGVGRLLHRSLKEQIEALALAKTSLSGRRAVVATECELGWVAGEINAMLDQLAAKASEAARANDAILRGLLTLASARDNETALHIRRTQTYVAMLAEDLARTDPSTGLGDEDVQRLAAAAPLHDIGKVAVPDAILRKPGKLTAEEFAIIQGHVAAGVEVIDTVIAEVGTTPFLATARDLIAGHHEKYDGTGYPAGRAGDAIPLAARIMAVADVYDALRTARVYKPALSHAAAADIIRKGAGTHFDPRVVAAFDRIDGAISATAATLADPDATTAQAA
jgi:HD-GYP domain-containing protein (c-di-GMP phosphodiesterase class II)